VPEIKCYLFLCILPYIEGIEKKEGEEEGESKAAKKRREKKEAAAAAAATLAAAAATLAAAAATLAAAAATPTAAAASPSLRSFRPLRPILSRSRGRSLSLRRSPCPMLRRRRPPPRLSSLRPLQMPAPEAVTSQRPNRKQTNHRCGG